MPSFVECRSFDVVHQSRLLGNWNQKYTQLSPGRFEGSVTELQLDGVTLSRERMNTAVQQMGSLPPKRFAVSHPINRDGLHHLDWRRDVKDGSGLMNSAGTYRVMSSVSSDVLVLSVSEEVLAEHMSNLEIGMTVSSVRTLTLPDGFERMAVDMLCQSRLGLADDFCENAAKRLLDSLASPICEVSAIGGARPWRTDRFVIVNDACDAAEEEGLNFATLHTMCHGARVSLRILQYAFREVLGVTPLKWLRIARLNAVHRDLIRLRPSGITDSALAHSFTHLGRFSVEYRSIFCESPRETLHRVRGTA
ncbi:helix-turn-helix domain-containing protein [Pseudomonas sp. v388]|uniref:helix-turn-helix domain-containing protein n=1 Tax=Pseudomonas sp. v388 TaxID=2479849 RepID=UPI000F79C0EC|nr:helix-turn-helix domain-containing protein [Pseudomonas sp. v388]RRV10533.1 helix-turn-helix domain-containing protein [Pseudomonas sp. v388]